MTEPSPRLETAPRPRVWPKALLSMGIDIALVLAVIAAAGWGWVSPETANSLALGVFLIGCAQLVGGFVLAFPERTRPLGLGLIFGLFLFIGTGILILGGACLVLVSLH